MASIIKRLWSGSDFWDKEENKQQRQQYAAPRPQPEMEQKIKTARYGVLANNPQRQQQFIQDTKATPGPSILSTVHNAINDTLNANTQADQQRRLSQGLPRYYQDQSNLSKITRAAETGGRVTARVLQGIGQDAAGAYDLLTPGHGTNRATKYYQNRGKETDQEVKDMGLDENVYKAGQVPLALGSYMIPGKAVSSAAKATQIAKVPQVVKLAGTLNKVPGVTKTIGALDDLAANGDRFQRITANLARSYTRPGNIADVGVDALQNAGHRTSLGQDNSAGTLALDAGMSLGMQGGMNLAGQGASAVVRAANTGIVQPTTRLVRNVANTVAPVQTTTKLIPRTGRLDLATSDALKAYNNMLVGADPNITGKVQSDLIARIQQIGKENGVDLTNGSVEQRMARVEAMLNGYLPQTQTGRQFVGKPLGEGGYIKNPLYDNPDTKILRDSYDRSQQLISGKGKKFTVAEAKQLIEQLEKNKSGLPMGWGDNKFVNWTPKQIADALNDPMSNRGRDMQKFLDRNIDREVDFGAESRIGQLDDMMDELEANPTKNYKKDVDRLIDEKKALEDINQDPYVNEYRKYVKDNADLIEQGYPRALDEAVKLREIAENHRLNIDEELVDGLPETRLLEGEIKAGELNRTFATSKNQGNLLEAKQTTKPKSDPLESLKQEAIYTNFNGKKGTVVGEKDGYILVKPEFGTSTELYTKDQFDRIMSKQDDFATDAKKTEARRAESVKQEQAKQQEIEAVKQRREALLDYSGTNPMQRGRIDKMLSKRVSVWGQEGTLDEVIAAHKPTNKYKVGGEYVIDATDGVNNGIMALPKTVWDRLKVPEMSRDAFGKKTLVEGASTQAPPITRENAILPRVGDTPLPIKQDVVIGDTTPLKKGNTRPDPLTTVSGRKIQLDQYNPQAKSSAADSRLNTKWNQTLIKAAIEEAKLRNDSMNLGIFEDMQGTSYKNLSESDISGIHQYLFDSPDSIKLTYNQATQSQPPKSTPFQKDLQAVGLAPSPQAKGSVGIPSRSTPKKPQRLEVPSDQTTELPRLRQSKANPANQPSNRNEVLSKETPVNAVDSTTNTKNTKPGLESRTPKKSLKTPQEKPVVSGTSRKLSTPEVKQPQNLQQPSTTASAGVGGQAVSKTQPEAYKQPKESQVSQNQVQSQESSSKTRGFIKSVLEDPNTNPKVKESISSLYTVRNTKELQTKAATLVKEHPDIAEQMSKSANDDASVAVAMELVKKHQNAGDYTRAIDLVESVAKDLTEAGRTVQAASIYGRLTPEGILRFTQKEINNYNKATGKDIKLTPKAADTLKTMADDLQKMPDGYDKDVAVAKMIAEVQKTMPATTAEKISTFQTMAQLLNPKTIIRNELGNSAFLGLENISQTVATPVDALMSLFTGKRTTTLPSVKTQVKGLIEGRKKGVSEAFQGINTGASTQYDLNSVPVFRGKVLGNLEKTMGAALRGGDRANYTAAFDDSLKGSMKLAKTKTATPEMLEAAHHAGLYRTFQDQNVISNFFVGMKKTLNTVGIGIKGKRFGLGDMVLKYPKTPANLLARGIDYSPAGFVKTVFEMSKPLFGKQFDQKVFVDSLSRATTGTAGLVGTGAMLGSLGIITEAPEKDKDLRDLQKQSGLGGYQINVSGLKRFVASGFSKDAAKLREGDKLVSYDWAQPAAIPVSMGAAIGKGKGAKEGAGKSVSALTEGIQTITEQPMVRGLQQFFGSNKGAGGIVGDLLKDTPASFIPTLSNQVRQLTDNTNRNTYDPSVLTESMNRVKNKIPGLASSVPARIGSLGETRENYQNGSNNPFNVFFNPSFVSNYDPKETAKLPLGINQRTGEVKQAPRSISTTQTVNGKSVKITAKQNQDLQKYVGTETDKAFSQLMKNPAFMALSDEEKANKMGTLITNINKAGKVLILGDEGYGTDSYKPTKLDRGVRDVLGGKYDYSTRSMKTGAASSDYAQQYADLKADFNDPNNGWSDVQKVAKTKELKRLEIKKDYDADTVALHDMSKADMYAYVSKAKNGKQLAEKLIAYDNALYEAGLSQYRKYKNGIAPASKGGGRKSGGRGGKRKAIPKDLMAKAMDVPKVAQLRQSKITAKQPQARSFKTRRKAIPKIAKSTPKLTVKRTQTA